VSTYDYILVGGGLQSGLLALTLADRRPVSKVCVVEAADRVGGNHTWSFHAADVPPEARDLIEPLVVASWPGYEARFADHVRVMPSRYATVTADRFDAVVRQVTTDRGWDLRLRARAAIVNANRVILDTGEELRGRCVIDARGPRDAGRGCGYQKFLGLEVETITPWPDRLPVVMDATIPQEDGFHFVYTLPLTPTRVLVEDTYFSDGPELDHSVVRRWIEAYLGRRVGGWRVVRDESGVLPMPWQPGPTQSADGPLVGGYAGGWFHPATGYSFPVALRFALAVATVPPEAAPQATAALARRLSPRWRFARFLNYLLFRLVPPDARWQVFARLYRTLPPAVLARFYALEFTAFDAARIVVGRPPRIDPFRALRLPRSSRWLSPSLS
jgi:lycopene beta-cyclase